nr:FGGY-family carbohydrate kinase [Mycobacterium sp. IDR2000157661]
MSAKAVIGVDIGTTSVKAVAVDEDGRVTARTRVPHAVRVPTPDRLEHDAGEAWRRGPLAALDALGRLNAAAVAVTAMVPSLTAVDADGAPQTPGLLYGDERGRGATGRPDARFLSGEAVEFLRWTAGERPGAPGYWPAAALANHALAGEAVIDNATASTMYPLFDGAGWSEPVCADCAVTPGQLPRIAGSGEAVGTVRGRDTLLGAGAVDAVCEQVVAGADTDGDVLVLCGTTLIVWVTIPEYREVPGLWTLPHTAPGKCQIGGPSNAGGLFLGWLDRAVAPGDAVDPRRVPVWAPYLRGERVPHHDPFRRGVLDGLDLTHDGAAIRRAGFEASGFVVRQLIEMSGAPATRIVATGGGTRVAPWMQAIADATGLPVGVSAVAEGAALGAAFLARMSAGLESSLSDAARWAATERVVEPDAAWVAATQDRYGRFLELSASPPPHS